jgi:hypothetical protein
VRRYALTIAFVLATAVLLVGGIACLRIAGVIAISAGYAPVAELQAFGRRPDPEQLERAWRNEERFRISGWSLMASSLGCALFAVRCLRRARRARVPWTIVADEA